MAYDQAQQILSKGWLPGTVGTTVTIQAPAEAVVESESFDAIITED